MSFIINPYRFSGGGGGGGSAAFVGAEEYTAGGSNSATFDFGPFTFAANRKAVIAIVQQGRTNTFSAVAVDPAGNNWNTSTSQVNAVNGNYSVDFAEVTPTSAGSFIIRTTMSGNNVPGEISVAVWQMPGTSEALSTSGTSNISAQAVSTNITTTLNDYLMYVAIQNRTDSDPSSISAGLTERFPDTGSARMNVFDDLTAAAGAPRTLSYNAAAATNAGVTLAVAYN